MSNLEVHLPALQVIVPLLTAPLVVLLQQRGLAWVAATAASLCSFGLAMRLVHAVDLHGELGYAVGSWPAPYGIELTVDAFSVLLLLIVSGASSMALLAARTSLDREVAVERQPLFYCAWLLVLAGLSGIVVAGDAFNIFVFMEISSLATYVLIAGGPQRRALTAVFKYLVMGTIGATFYLIGVGLLYMMTGTLNLGDMEARLRDVADLKPVLVAGGFITVGLVLKAAVFPLHTWLPNAYAYAPHAVSVFIAACSTKIALYVLLRFDFLVFRDNLAGYDTHVTAFVLPLALLAVLVASGIAIFEQDLKRLLAYSSIAQIGYILIGASLGSVTGLAAGIVHMFNHALSKGALFLAVVSLSSAGAALSVHGLAGEARRQPLAMAAFVVAGLSLIGIPGTAGFVSKWYLAVAALEFGSGGVWLVVAVLVSSLMAVAYVWRVIEAAYFGSAGTGVRTERPGWALAALWIAAVANVYFGLQPELPFELASDAAEVLLQPPTS